MSNFSHKTKKEIILENAYRDPFLKIEDLSKMADTTSRYVRTILSESNLSLMDLRKDYARKMENNKYNINDILILNYLNKLSFIHSTKNINELILNSSADINIIADNVQNNYIHQSYEYLSNNRSWSLCSVFMEKGFIERENLSLSNDELLKVINCKIDNNDVNISNLDIIIDISTGQLSKFLRINELNPIVRLRQTITYESVEVALILVYFDARQISFSLSHKGGITIKRKSAVD
ncbi:MAG: hypothetical protein ACOCQW_05285 [Halanaerobiaceae bacterium]